MMMIHEVILHETTATTVVLQDIARTSYKQTNLSTIFVVALRWIIRNKTIPCTYCGTVGCLPLYYTFLSYCRPNGLLKILQKLQKNFSLSHCSLVFTNRADLLAQIRAKVFSISSATREPS